ncbi:Alpha-tocopherol transfer protein [Folsomia candida]|uniref:Alpha-tocopherol transfer protein n=1 Tax=Folsomia candida TaxID=158441 RepID=A0A226CY95_FOLCA|nr:Alpha-tocopherol transfer protein [Folsomia candida]
MVEIIEGLRFASALAELKCRIQKDEKIEPYSDILDDKFLMGFLRGKKWDVDKAMICLQHYIKMRTVKYKNFTKLYRPSTVKFLDKGVLNLLKHRDPHGRLVLLAQINKWSPSEIPADEAIATALFIVDEGIRSFLSTGNECVAIFDCAGITFAQARNATPKKIILLIDMFTKNIPTKPKGVHFINHGFIVHHLYRFASPMLEKKIRERVHFHSNTSQLHGHIPAKILPTSLDGELETEDAFDTSQDAVVRGNDYFYERLAR